MFKLKQQPEDFVVVEKTDLVCKSKGSYTIFVLQKKGLTTEEAVQRISKILHIPRKFISCAGLKDKQAITRQYISVKGDFQKKSETIKLDDINLDFVGYLDQPIVLGNLVGNRFEIVVRNLDQDFKLNKNITIPNYFDDQRFSKHNLEIGRALVKADFKSAVDLVLKGRGDYEQQVKMHISVLPKDSVGALKKIPKSIFKIYLPSLQSYIFNETLVAYIQNQCKQYAEIDYSKGKMVFPIEDMENRKIPVVGFGLEIKETDIKSLIEEIMKREKISQNDFIIRSMPHISCEGDVRDLLIDVKDMKISDLEPDELNKDKKKIKIMFYLAKGSYATIVIKALCA